MTPPLTRRVLLVEDNDLNRSLVRAVLARSDNPIARTCTLIEASNLATARTALAAGHVDLILLDVQLPDGSGLSLVDDLAGQPEPTRPVVIAFTAGALPEHQAAAQAAGCDGVLTKPYRPNELIDVLTTHLDATHQP